MSLNFILHQTFFSMSTAQVSVTQSNVLKYIFALSFGLQIDACLILVVTGVSPPDIRKIKMLKNIEEKTNLINLIWIMLEQFGCDFSSFVHWTWMRQKLFFLLTNSHVTQLFFSQDKKSEKCCTFVLLSWGSCQSRAELSCWCKPHWEISGLVNNVKVYFIRI